LKKEPKVENLFPNIFVSTSTPPTQLYFLSNISKKHRETAIMIVRAAANISK
jgi:hypothetical protein